MAGNPGKTKSILLHFNSRPSAHPELIRGWRQKALDWVLRGIFVFTTPVLILGLINLAQDSRQGFPLFQAIYMGGLYIAVYLYMMFITFGRRFGYSLRAGSLLVILISVGVADLIAGGLSSDGLLIILAVIALAAVFYDLRQTFIVQAAGMGLILGIAWLLVSGRLVVAPEMQTNSANLASWLVRLPVFALLSTAIVLSTTYLVRSLEQSLVSAKKQADQLTTMQDIALDILAHTSMKEMLAAAACRAADLLDAAGGLVFLVDECAGNLTLAGICGPGQENIKSVLRPGEGVAGRVLAARSPLIVRDHDRWDWDTDLLPKGVWGSIVQVPVSHLDKVIGVMGCYTLAGDLREFDGNDIVTLERLARQASVAIESVRLLEAARQAETRLDAIVQTAPVAIVSLDRDQKIITFNRAAEEMFFCKAGEVIGQPFNTLTPERCRDEQDKIVESFVRSGKEHSSWLAPRELLARRSNNDEFPVEITVTRVDDESDLFLTIILRDITIKKQAQSVIEEDEHRSRVLLEFSKNLELSQTYQAVIEAALDVAHRTAGYKNIWFYSVSMDKKFAHLLGAAGKKAERAREMLSRIQISGDPFLERVADNLTPVIIPDARQDANTNKAIVARLGCRTIVSIPVQLSGQRLGILGMGTFGEEGERIPDRSQVDFLTTMAAHIAISMDRITQANERARAENEMVRGYQIQAILNRLLSIALENQPLERKLGDALDVILSTPWLPTLPKGAVFLAEELTGDLVLCVHRNLDQSLQSRCARIRPGQCLCGRAAPDGYVQFGSYLDTRHESHSDEMEPHSHYNAPIRSRGALLGVLVLYLSGNHVWDEREVKFLNAVANTLASLIGQAKAQEQIEQANADLALAYDTTLEGWSKALDLRDKETGDHTGRVAALTVSLARWMGMPEDDLAHIWRGALLHDIGKMSIPDATLKKTDQLTEKEWKVMRHHPQNAYDMLVAIPYLRPAMDIPYCHHEKWDGSGYPRGLKGKEIPLAARIFAVVDVWDALKSDRPYRKAWPEEKIFDYFREQSGKHFDPRVVDAFIEMHAHIKANGG